MTGTGRGWSTGSPQTYPEIMNEEKMGFVYNCILVARPDSTVMVSEERRPVPLSAIWRFYCYGLHGYCTEIMFTALWEYVVNINWKFPGNTSVWCFFIYGSFGMIMEQMYFQMKGNVPFLVRGLVYTLGTYIWEFSIGYILSRFGACPWDYTLFQWDVMGLVTLEYAPLWYIGNLFSEYFLLRYTSMLYWGVSTSSTVSVSHNRKTS
ncbi:transmembrane protein 229B-like [Ylistrum balloti]|uniref:transmembrane protein 229B-like n=1 Tax=Ylistrum balloti TaxID=509963 RepID=UPI002905D7B0|nr:transmembrane protein 229B-like [Ylistrum balloti]